MVIQSAFQKTVLCNFYPSCSASDLVLHLNPKYFERYQTGLGIKRCRGTSAVDLAARLCCCPLFCWREWDCSDRAGLCQGSAVAGWRPEMSNRSSPGKGITCCWSWKEFRKKCCFMWHVILLDVLSTNLKKSWATEGLRCSGGFHFNSRAFNVFNFLF